MEELLKYRNYEEYKKTVDSVLNKTVEDFVTIGYLLKKGRDTDILKESGYANVNEFAEAEYHLEASQVSRFIRINDKFAEQGYSDRLKEQYRGFGYAKLAIMLTLPDEVNEELSPSFSKAEIQAVKEEVEEESKITDIEVILEGEKKEQTELNELQKVLSQIFEDTPELFKNLYEQMKENHSLQTVKEILAPAGEKVYSARIQGVGRIMLFLNDSEEKIKLIKVRTNEKESHTWEELQQYIEGIVSDRTPEERWSELYDREFPEKEEIAPVQTGEKPKKRKETKVQKAKAPERKAPRVEKTEAKELSGVKEESKKEEIAPVQTESKPVASSVVEERQEKDSGQMEGQTELTKDFPQYCPDAMNQPEAAAGSPYRRRIEYIRELDMETLAEYMAEAMGENRSITFSALLQKEYWENWLENLVDDAGKVIEEG